MKVAEIIMGIYLGILSGVDIRKKKISIRMLVIGAVLSVVCVVFGSKVVWLDRVIGAAIGAVLLIISFLTREAIGKADGILLIYLGVCTGYFRYSRLLLVSFSLCCLVSMIRLGFHVITKKQRIAFVPFLLIGFLSCWYTI